MIFKKLHKIFHNYNAVIKFSKFSKITTIILLSKTILLNFILKSYEINNFEKKI